MVTMSSALSSSSDWTMRARISGAFAAGLGALSRFTAGAAAFGFLAVLDFAGAFLAAAGALAFFGAFAAPVVLRVRIQILQGTSMESQSITSELRPTAFPMSKICRESAWN
jgi:hypothetical protein